MSNLLFPGPAELYVPDTLAKETVLRAERVRILVSRAFLGESFAKLLGLDNEGARIANQAKTGVVQLDTFNRKTNSERHAESSFRRFMLPGVLSMISDNFVFDVDLIAKPHDSSVLAELPPSPESPRSICITRFLVSVDQPADPSIVDQSKLRGDGGLPGVVSYVMILQDVEPTPSEQA